ncbi:uncharacterized protein LOC132298962 isoform X2 [Cornus florida]|nr:uncharacterized protein LOC132298962 isoform X2 [Cornus florida]
MNPNDPQDTPNKFSSNSSPVRAPALQEDAEPKGGINPQAVRSKQECRTSREDGEVRMLSNSPLHPDTVGQRATTDLSLQHHGGVRSGSSKSESGTPKGTLRPRHDRRPSREDGDLRRPTESPLHHDTVGRRTTVDSPYHRYGGLSTGDTPRRVSRQSAGSDRSIEHSPLHPHYQAKVGVKGSGVSSPSWDRKGSSEGSHGLAPSTPGRSRLRSVNRGDGTPDHSPAVPKFGDWDESDPASAEGYTHIFNRVREERQSEAGKVPVTTTENFYSNRQKQYGNENSKSCCCFPWGRK